jgi:hypothetical protein
MEELKNLRTYNRKVIKLDNNKKEYRFHTAHQFYKNKQTGEFEEIDTTLIFDINRRKFIVNKASYNAEIPEYADEVIGFDNLFEGSNHNISAKPICGHVLGVAFNNQKDGNYVFYENAYREGVHLKIYAYNQGLKEVIIIDKKPENNDEDLVFDFELNIKNSISFKDSQEKVWDKSKDYDFSSKTIKIVDDSNKESFFRIANVWDSEHLIQPVNISLYNKDNKIYLRKTITTSFIEKAVFPIFTDHATNYYSGSGDGYVSQSASDFSPSDWSAWDTAHDGLGDGFDYTGQYFTPGPYVAGNAIYLNRTFIPVDTSSIDDSVIIDSASLFTMPAIIYDQDLDGDNFVTVVQTFQFSTSTLQSDDFIDCGDAVDNPTEGMDVVNRVSLTDMVVDSYHEYVLNSTGLSWINKTGYTKIGLREGHDVLDHAPANDIQGTRFVGYTSEYTGTSKDPYLSIITSSPSNNTSIDMGFHSGVRIS